MMKILIYLFNHIFRRNKSFIVWSSKEQYYHCGKVVIFTYFITYYPYRVNKYELDCSPKEHNGDKKHYFIIAKWNLQEAYARALNKLSEFQREELIDLITLPKIEGVKQ